MQRSSLGLDKKTLKKLGRIAEKENRSKAAQVRHFIEEEENE